MKVWCIAVVCCSFFWNPTLFTNAAEVRQAWIRKLPGPLRIFSDNVGNVAVVGSEFGPASVSLLNKGGQQVRSISLPFPSIRNAVADSSGRIFVLGGGFRSTNVSCVALAPLLSDLLWVEQRDLAIGWTPPWAYAEFGSLVPDQNGGAYAFGEFGFELSMQLFRGDGLGLNQTWFNPDDPHRFAVCLARAPSGEVYFVANSLWMPRYPWLTVFKYSPLTSKSEIFGADPSPDAFYIPAAATCDSDGNLIIVGRRSTEYIIARGRCFIRKMNPDLSIAWEAEHGGLDHGPGMRLNMGRAVAVDASKNLFMTGDSGTVKYASDGRILWEAPEVGDTLLLDRFGHVLLSRQAEGEITKLNVDGTREWQIRTHDGSVAGLAVDDRDDIYFAASNGEQTTIVKLVEYPISNPRK